MERDEVDRRRAPAIDEEDEDDEEELGVPLNREGDEAEEEDAEELGVSGLGSQREQGRGGGRGRRWSSYAGGELRLASAMAIGSEATGRLGAITCASAAEKRERRKGKP